MVNFKTFDYKCKSTFYSNCPLFFSVSQQNATALKSAELSTMNASTPSLISQCISARCRRCYSTRSCNFEQIHFHFSMSGPNSSSEWSIEGRRLVPLMPRLVPQTAFTVTANAVANATASHNASLPVPAETGNKEGATTSASF